MALDHLPEHLSWYSISHCSCLYTTGSLACTSSSTYLKLRSLFLSQIFLLLQDPCLSRKALSFTHLMNPETRQSVLMLHASSCYPSPPHIQSTTKPCGFHFKSYQLSSLWQELPQWCSLLKAHALLFIASRVIILKCLSYRIILLINNL